MAAIALKLVNQKTKGKIQMVEVIKYLGNSTELFVCWWLLRHVLSLLQLFFTLPETFIQLNAINLVWLTQCLVIFLISLKASHAKYGSQSKAFNFWDDKIKPEMDALGIEFPEEKIKKRQKICIAIATCFVTLNVGCLVMFSVDVFSRGLDIFDAAPFAPSIPVLIVANCLMIEITLLWVMPVFYIIVISSLLIATFETFNEYLENHITQNLTNMTCKCRVRFGSVVLGRVFFNLREKCEIKCFWTI